MRFGSGQYGQECRVRTTPGGDDTHMCLSILPASLYFLKSLLRTLILRNHMTLVGILASAVPFLLPVPVCLPFLLAACMSLTLAREWMMVGLTMMCPSLRSFRTPDRELALLISVASWGSSQTFLLPTPAMSAANLRVDA
jgi:hypothetical protein